MCRFSWVVSAGATPTKNNIVKINTTWKYCFIEWLFDQALDAGRLVFRSWKPPIFEPNPFFAYEVCHSVNIQLRCNCKAKFLPSPFNIPLHLTNLCIHNTNVYFWLHCVFFFHDLILVSHCMLCSIQFIQSRFTYCAACALDKGLPFSWEICTEWFSFSFSMVKSSSSGIDLWLVMLAGLCSWYID